MFHRFTLTSDYTPGQCRTALQEATSGGKDSDAPRGFLWGRWFRLAQSEYFEADGRSRIIYTVYGTMKAGENDRTSIVCYQFQSLADPLKYLMICAFIFFALCIGPISLMAGKLLLYLRAALLSGLVLVAADWFRIFLSCKATKESLPSTIGEFLREILHAQD